MRKYEYSDELVNLVKKFLVEDDWSFSFNENTGIFDFGLRVRSKLQKINYIVDVHDDEIIVYGMCPIGADHTDANMMMQMAEFICRANYGLRNGCFELDFNDGEIRFKSYIDCEDVLPSINVIKNCIYCIASTFKRYASGIVDIICSVCTAKEAIAKCEKAKKDELRSMLTEDIGDDMEGAEIEEILARLVARFGITEDSEEGSVSDTNGSVDEGMESLSDGEQEGDVI